MKTYKRIVDVFDKDTGRRYQISDTMVEVEPFVFVNAVSAVKLGLISQQAARDVGVRAII